MDFQLAKPVEDQPQTEDEVFISLRWRNALRVGNLNPKKAVELPSCFYEIVDVNAALHQQY